MEYDGRPTLTLSAAKRSLPGPKQVYRHRDEDGEYLRDVIALHVEDPRQEGGEPLLSEVMTGGERRYQAESLQVLSDRFSTEFASLPDRHKALTAPPMYEVTPSDKFERLAQTVAQRVTQAGIGR